MRTRLSTVAAALLLCSCIKRVNPDPGGDRSAVSGAWLRFGQEEALPEGSEAQWDFGDGTPQQKGVAVTHAFPRAGVYTVVETIVDKDQKTRSARTHVAVLRRDVAMACRGRSALCSWRRGRGAGSPFPARSRRSSPWGRSSPRWRRVSPGQPASI